MANTHTVKYIHPPNLLRNKVGKGGLPKDVIDDAQRIITEQRIDIRPYLREQLAMLDTALREANSNATSFYDKRNNILKPLAMLKAHGGMFGYALISEIAEVALEFVEHLRELDPDGLDLLQRHCETIQTIIDHNIRGDGGDEGYALSINLYKASQEYAAKRKQ